jgi:hypothetical protein
LEGVTLQPCTLGAKFCKWRHKCGGVCIFIQDNIHYTNINMDRYCNENDIEICAVKLITYFISYHHYNNYLQISNW